MVLPSFSENYTLLRQFRFYTSSLHFLLKLRMTNSATRNISTNSPFCQVPNRGNGRRIHHAVRRIGGLTRGWALVQSQQLTGSASEDRDREAGTADRSRCHGFAPGTRWPGWSSP